MSYLPKAFEVQDAAQMQRLVAAHPLATWVQTDVDGALQVHHLPLWLDPQRGPQGTLFGHVARANPLWRSAGRPGVAVFHGPQAYVSPSWYPAKQVHGKVVPTWNYAVVHAHGALRLVTESAAVRDILRRLTDRQEADQARPWRLADAPADYLEGQLGAIVGIEIEIERWVGKFKLGQNRSEADRQGVVAGLLASREPGARGVAEEMACWPQEAGA